MSLATGTQLGSYEVLSLLGKGGMGEVYLARDTKLKRTVAIKTLPEEFNRDPERLARFQREAEALAALNHPNIGSIYHLQESEGSRYLVLELVEGDTLADILAKRGALTVDEAVKIAKQICEALEAAHEKGITHRDLKPANIKVTPDGKVKLLDFGLARMFEQQANVNLSNSPTVASDFTPGVILGTAAYMSPEQAKGELADKRSDIWAFGCVLYEVLSGRPVFEGKTLTEVLGAVMYKDIDWTALTAPLPVNVWNVLRRCLQKDRSLRLRDVGDVRIELDEVPDGQHAVVGVSLASSRSRSKFLIGTEVAFLLTMLASIGALSFLYFNRGAPPEIRFQVQTPSMSEPVNFSISPDGRRLVYSATNEGKSQLWVRPLDSLAAQPLPGTDGASQTFWSPDSASIGFFADGKLKRVDIAGGAPHVLANAPVAQGGAWNREGTILFATSEAPILKVSATGGEPVVVTHPESGQRHLYPQFLPDGRHFVYSVIGPAPGVYGGSLDGAAPKRVADAVNDMAFVSPSGFLLFVRQTTLFAQAFDFKRQEVSGNPFPVAEAVSGFWEASGTVAYRNRLGGVPPQLTWLDRSGKTVGTIGDAGSGLNANDVELSPDGKRIAVTRTVNGNSDVWIIDAARNMPTRFTFDAASDSQPIWSPDGARVVFRSNRKGVNNLYWKLSNGAGGEELLLESDQTSIMPNDWSHDGRFLLFRSLGPQTGRDLWVLPLVGDKKPFPFLKTAFEEREGQFSPDGKWIAYQSNESGRFEIYVQPFPGPGGKFQISSNGGAQPRWSRNGKEIFYVSLESKMMAATLKVSPNAQSLESETPEILFPVRIANGPVLPGANKQQYAVSGDSQRFLVNLAADEGATPPITVIVNWQPKATK
jgi:serine/threonine protein kinase